ncbi:MAG: glycosyltransferase family 9 protein [Alphaproteobacteria bacterium]
MTDSSQPKQPVDAHRILVIKLGALGDFIQAFGPFQAIRQAYPEARICLLTTPPFENLAQRSGWFDTVLLDSRPRLTDIAAVLDLRHRLMRERFDLVVDLQTSGRSSAYRKLIWPQTPLWSGIAKEASHRHENPRRDTMHTIDRQAEQLAMIGIEPPKRVSMDWLTGGPPVVEGLSDRFALLLPGGAPHRPEKRWPATRYAGLAQSLSKTGVQPVVLGTATEAEEAEIIQASCPQALNLIGRTSLPDIAALAGQADLAVGNDTGPMHLASVCGCPSVVIFSHASDPALCGQRGPHVAILRNEEIAAISVQQVVEAAEGLG